MIVYLQMLHSAPEQDKFRALYEAYSGLIYHVADRLLPAAYREALLLRYQQGYTAREIAHMLGKKTGAVQKLLTRAKAALREELDERGIDHA